MPPAPGFLAPSPPAAAVLAPEDVAAIAARPVQLGSLPPGKAGTAQTVALMAQLAMGPWGAQSQAIRDLAVGIVQAAGVPAKDYRGEVEAVHAWMRRVLRYTRDPVGQERVQTPEATAFVQRTGDCDDFTVLEAALLGALGHPTRFVTIGFTPRAFSHVYLEALIRDQWLALDPIMADKPVGWAAANPTIIKRFPINRAEGFDPATQAMDGLGGLPLIPLLLLGGGLVGGGVAGYALGRGVSRAMDDVGLLLVAALGAWLWWKRNEAAGTSGRSSERARR